LGRTVEDSTAQFATPTTRASSPTKIPKPSPASVERRQQEWDDVQDQLHAGRIFHLATVIDSLLWHKDNPVNFSLDQAMALRDKIQPKQTYPVGTNHDSFLPHHDEMNVVLKKEYGGIRWAFH
jgi:hypothetical protein